ncbi:GNAT family N-acetyltransferase [Heyndrickxia oleronia]|uniref:GNAT family N-acetyltransferase n=1 Tax=Heyndrickxia oleronia TaxID=38875 RepID=UPI0020422110|nr:GNAT family N-acetyltransferase [Heyndrickxia oleronia]MCM3238357.1 GNAT family N-acetyltransferase [Heyndrickxia oleronia]
MLKQCDNSWKDSIYEYIGNKYSECLYLYINLQKYGLDNNNFHIWVSLDENSRIRALIARYYTGVHIYCNSSDYLIDDILEFIQKNKPSIITATGKIIKNIEEFCLGYTAEYGSVGQIKSVPAIDTSMVEKASIDDMNEISRLLISDEGLGDHYNQQLLEHQLKERLTEGYGRNYIIKKENAIISHCATYAEIRQIGVTSGVFTKPEERGKKLAYRTYCQLCSDLLEEGKEVFAYYYTNQAHKMHEKLGFEIISSWAKLVKR